MTDKSADYFKRVLESQNKQSKAFVSKVTVSEKDYETSYLTAELIAQKRKSYTIGEDLIKTACKIFGQAALREIENIPLSKKAIN
jgi:hypothetical protein